MSAGERVLDQPIFAQSIEKSDLRRLVSLELSANQIEPLVEVLGEEILKNSSDRRTTFDYAITIKEILEAGSLKALPINPDVINIIVKFCKEVASGKPVQESGSKITEYWKNGLRIYSRDLVETEVRRKLTYVVSINQLCPVLDILRRKHQEGDDRGSGFFRASLDTLQKIGFRINRSIIKTP